MAFLMNEDVDIVNEIDEIADNSADVVQKMHQKTVPNSWIDDLIDRANRLKYEMEAENLISNRTGASDSNKGIVNFNYR